MPDDEPGNAQEDSVAGPLLRFSYIPAIAVVLYVLSPGPIAKYLQCSHGTATPSIARAATIAYAPIVLAYQHVPAFEHFWNWYMKDIWRLRGTR